MAYDKFHILKSTAVPLPIENVDMVKEVAKQLSVKK